jgi:hypothetical protein
LGTGKMNLTTILDDCLQRLAAGESVAQCLARYPEAAPELAPMLAAAEQVRAFSAVRLSQGQRLRAKVALREELATQGMRRKQAALPIGMSWPRWRLAPLAALLAVVLFSTVAFSAVAASKPGDPAYPVRVAVERAPVWFQFSAHGRIAAELALADRRLAEATREGAAHPVAIAALLRSDAEAIRRAEALSAADRAQVAARVTAHAAELEKLAAQSSQPELGASLLQAAAQAQALASRWDVIDGPDSAPTATASMTPTRTPVPTNTAVPVVAPTLSVTPSAAPAVPTLVVPTVLPVPTVPRVVAPTAPAMTAAPTSISTETTTPRRTVDPRRTDRPRRTPVATAGPIPVITVPTISIPTVVAPTVVVPTVVVPTVVAPTVIVPTGVAPQPTGIATQAVNTPVIPTVVVPTITVPTVTVPTVLAPTVVLPTLAVPPTVRPPGAQLTATVVWMTMTPAPTRTPRPDIRLTVTLTVVLPRQTHGPAATATPIAPTMEAPTPTATEAGSVAPTLTPEALETATPEAAPTLPPMPR